MRLKKKTEDVENCEVEETLCDDSETDEKAVIEEIKQLKQNMDSSHEEFEMLKNVIEKQIEVKDDLICKLHKELELYKQDSMERYKDEVMKQIIKIRNDMKKEISSNSWMDKNADDIRMEYEYIFDDLTDLLEIHNIEPFCTKEGSKFDASVQTARVEETEDPAFDKTVKKSLCEGYKKGDKVLIPERVVVYKYKETKKAE